VHLRHWIRSGNGIHFSGLPGGQSAVAGFVGSCGDQPVESVSGGPMPQQRAAAAQSFVIWMR
jgi:hypothetical protein